jgi:hypothetical protein
MLARWQTAVVRKKRFLWVGVGVIALVTVWFGFLRPRDEPKYQGRYLSEWAAIRGPAPYGSPVRAEAELAIRNIGTNALPLLLEWMHYQTPEWKLTLHRNLPRWIQRNGTYGLLLFGAASRANHSYGAIMVLGTNAVSAVPELEGMLRDRAKSDPVLRAIQALNYLGEPGWAALQRAFADTNQLHRFLIVRSVASSMSEGLTNARQALLLQALDDTDIKVRLNATNAVRDFAPHLLSNAPGENH